MVNYEIVLADGSLVEANKEHHPDLFWALKGGSSNFGIVTRFDVQTIHSPKIWGGTHTVAGQYIDQFLDVCLPYLSAVFGMVMDGADCDRLLLRLLPTSLTPRLTLSRLLCLVKPSRPL